LPEQRRALLWLGFFPFGEAARSIGRLSLTLAAFTLADEFVKEGYLFWPGDLLTPWLTHEKIILALVGIFLGALPYYGLRILLRALSAISLIPLKITMADIRQRAWFIPR